MNKSELREILEQFLSFTRGTTLVDEKLIVEEFITEISKEYYIE
jgi:hypothetical protein